MKKSISLSKSRIMRGIQCAKSLYLEVHDREIASPISESQQAIFDQGHEVGFEAQKQFSGGVLIEAEYWDTKGSFEKTLEEIEKGTEILFEATIIYEGVSARTDILRLLRKGVWEIIEVKSSTSVKDEHLEDAAVQLWVFRKYGFNVEKISILHINNKCVAPVKNNLFTKVDVTEDVEARLSGISQVIKKLFKTLESKKIPDVDIGPHCTSPYECPFMEHCWKHIPVPSAFDIPRIGAKVWKLYDEDKIQIKKLDEKDFNTKQARAINVLKSGKRFVDSKTIKNLIKLWQWPMYFLDFETFNPAIPLYVGTRPYQQIPFQFSCHVLEKLDSKIKHFEYLHLDNSDPREAVARSLAEGFGSSGSVVAYNKGFESGVLKDLAVLFPNYRKKLISIADRLVDPWPIIEASVYDKKFLGTFSLKSVAPALLGEHMSYEELQIAEGGGASLAYLNLIKGQLSKEERDKSIQAMLEYCRQDTMATVELVKWLFNTEIIYTK